MRSLPLIVLLISALCIPLTSSSAGEKHTVKDAIKDIPGGWKEPRPYWEQDHYPSPYHYPPPYYYPYPSIPYQRYKDTRRSPYDSLEVKQAGRISIVVQPLDAEVLVDGYQLTKKDDSTYEVGLLTGIHKVEAKKGGYKPYSIEVVVEAGRTVSLTIELKKGK